MPLKAILMCKNTVNRTHNIIMITVIVFDILGSISVFRAGSNQPVNEDVIQ
jgi:hypothetical protein